MQQSPQQMQQQRAEQQRAAGYWLSRQRAQQSAQEGHGRREQPDPDTKSLSSAGREDHAGDSWTLASGPGGQTDGGTPSPPSKSPRSGSAWRNLLRALLALLIIFLATRLVTTWPRERESSVVNREGRTVRTVRYPPASGDYLKWAGLLGMELLAVIALWRLRPKGERQEKSIVGEVRGFVARTEEKITIWNFRLERYDSAGNRLVPVPVEMHGWQFKGFIRDGDRVEVHVNEWREGETLQPKRVRNLTTDDTVTSRGALGPFWGTVYYLFLIFILGVFAFLFVSSLVLPLWKKL